MFSCFLVDGLRVVANSRAAPYVFLCMSNSNYSCYGELNVSVYVELNVSAYVELNCSCYVELKFFLELNVFLVASNSKCSSQLCSEFTQLRQRVLLSCVLTSWKVLAVALSSMHTPWREPLFSTLYSVQEHHCILYQESTLLCQLWTLHYSATLKYRCAYWSCDCALSNILKRVVHISLYFVVLHKFVHYVCTRKFSWLKLLDWENFLRLLWTTSKSCKLSRIVVDCQSTKYCRIYLQNTMAKSTCSFYIIFCTQRLHTLVSVFPCLGVFK